MHPEGVFAPHWYLVGSLLARANDNPLSPAVDLANLFDDLATSDLFNADHKFDPTVFHDALTQCINWGLIAAEYDGETVTRVAVSPLGTYFMTTDREMRVGRQRPQFLSLPDGADHSVFMIQMGYEEVRSRKRMNAYRNLVSVYSLPIPAEAVFEKLDAAIETIRVSNGLNAELKEQILSKLSEGRRRWRAGPITIAILAALILNPLQQAWNAITEEVFKPQIQSTVKLIKEATGI